MSVKWTTISIGALDREGDGAVTLATGERIWMARFEKLS